MLWNNITIKMFHLAILWSNSTLNTSVKVMRIVLYYLRKGKPLNVFIVVCKSATFSLQTCNSDKICCLFSTV